MDEDEDQNDEEEINKKSWGGRKNIYYNADTADFEVGFLELRNYFLQLLVSACFLDTTVS